MLSAGPTRSACGSSSKRTGSGKIGGAQAKAGRPFFVIPSPTENGFGRRRRTTKLCHHDRQRRKDAATTSLLGETMRTPFLAAVLLLSAASVSLAQSPKPAIAI